MEDHSEYNQNLS